MGKYRLRSGSNVIPRSGPKGPRDAAIVYRRSSGAGVVCLMKTRDDDDKLYKWMSEDYRVTKTRTSQDVATQLSSNWPKGLLARTSSSNHCTFHYFIVAPCLLVNTAKQTSSLLYKLNLPLPPLHQNVNDPIRPLMPNTLNPFQH